MLGAIIGDIAGSRFEWNNIKSKDFELLSHEKRCRPTDKGPGPEEYQKYYQEMDPATAEAFITGSTKTIRSLIAAGVTVPLCASVPADSLHRRLKKPGRYPKR